MENRSKYIESINGNLELKHTNKNLLDYPRGLSALLDKNELEILNSYSKNIHLVKIKATNRILKIAFYDIVSSGTEKNPSKKRIQIPVWKEEIDLTDVIAIGIYYYEPNVYIYLENNEFIKNKRENINSLWMRLEPIVYSQRFKTNFKYYPSFNANVLSDRQQQDLIIFNNFSELIEYITKPYKISEVTFLTDKIQEISKEIKELSSKLKKDSDKFNEFSNEKLVSGIDIMKLSIANSSRRRNINNNSAKVVKTFIKKYKVNQVDYLKTEELIFKLLNEDHDFREYFLIKANEEKINSVIWNNNFEESYLPYDILVNDNVFIDVKATWKFKNKTFQVSENELNFKEKLLKENKKYLIILVSNISEESELEVEILTSDDIEKLDRKFQIIYIIEPFRCIKVSN